MRRHVAVIVLVLAMGPAAGFGAAAWTDEVAQAPVLAAGEIRAIDKDAGQLTIDHGPLLNLDVPPAVRVFQVRDRSVLAQLEVGDAVLFLAENIAGQLTVIRIQIGPGEGHGEH